MMQKFFSYVYDIKNISVSVQGNAKAVDVITSELVEKIWAEVESEGTKAEELFPDVQFSGVDDLPPPGTVSDLSPNARNNNRKNPPNANS